ncbi:MAG: hypothetical protein ACFE8Z_00370 [Candidatus Hermodarchaeota archaeon]
MYMVAAFLLLGVLSIAFSYIWYRRLNTFNELFTFFFGRFNPDEVDISGRRKYTRCLSHRWFMKNIVHGDYLKSGEGLSDFVGQNTLSGTMLVGMLLGVVPMILVYIFIQSFTLAGASLAVVMIAVFIVRSPGEVEISYDLLGYLTEQELSELKIGDLAYAKLSHRRITLWMRTLLLIGVVSIIVSPWGELIPEAVAFSVAALFEFFMTQVFVPVAAFSYPLALLLYICAIPLSLTLIYLVLSRIRKRVETRGEKDSV